MVDYSTTNPVIVHFPRLAGGKFVINCLGLSKHASLQNPTVAKYLIEHPDDYEYRYQCVLHTLPPKEDTKNWIQKYEFGDKQCYGNDFSLWEAGNKPTNPTKLVKQLSVGSQRFFITAHGGTPEVRNYLSVWPNASIIILYNSEKFRSIAAKIKTNQVFDHGLYTKEKYQSLAGMSWPMWESFEDCLYNINCLGDNFSQDIKNEIGQFYDWNTITNNVIGFNVDQSMFDKSEFVASIKKLYDSFNFDDFDEKLITKFWKSYIALHV